MSKVKILIVDSTHSIIRTKLEHAGFICHTFRGNSTVELLKIIDQYSGIIIRSKFSIDKALIDAATSLQFIGRLGSGMENIDIEYAKNKSIVCINSPEGNRDAVAEHAMGMLLSLLNNLNRADSQIRAGKWERELNRGTEIMDKTIGIIGFGNTGSEFARRLQGFKCKILAFDKYKNGYGNDYVKESTLTDLYALCDIVSLHLPLNSETRNMINHQFIKAFEKKIILINTSRGGIVKTADLVTALKSGKVKAAALDVLEYEAASFENLYSENLPVEFSYLINSDNVILSPHIAGWTHESYIKLSEILADKIIRLLQD